MSAPARGLRILERAVYRGPHLYSPRPMIRIQVDLGGLEERPSDTLPGFTDALLAELPGLNNHGCSYEEPGGLVRRLRDGTWMGHIAEHMALELQTRAGAPVTRGKTRSVKGRPGVYNVMYTYLDDQAGLLAGRLAFQILARLLPPEFASVQGLDRIYANPDEPQLAEANTAAAALPILTRAVRRGALGPTTQGLVDAARRRGIPVQRLNSQSLVQLGWGARQRRIRASVTDRTGLIATELAGNKAEAKEQLEAIAVPVPRGAVVRTADEAIARARRLKRPLVVKPLDGNHGRGVTTGLETEEQIRAAFALAQPISRRVVIEEQAPGRDHRILVVDGKLVAAAERVPPHVTGDGVRTIRELVEEVNADPRRGAGHENVLTKIRLDDAARDLLARSGMTFDSMPDAGQIVMLSTTANLSAGGTAIDRTDVIHPDNASIARRAALALGLDVAGIDLLAPDITKSVRETGGGIVEVNAAPGLRMHLQPSEGQARDVAEPIVEMLFPRGSRARIPVLAISGTNGKSTVGRMLAHIFRCEGRTVGLTNTSGVYIGEERIFAGDASGPKSARMVLRDPTVDVAVLECARGGILREGLAFDVCDVAAVLNVQPDHLGLGGIETIEDLAKVKSVVVESVSRRGVSVLNADDPMTLRMARHAGGRTCWFSLRGGSETPSFILKHLADGGAAALYDESTGEITLHDRGESHRLCKAADVPATLNGKAVFNVQNVMAASAMAFAAGVRIDRIASAMTGFRSTFDQNPGRLNVHDGHGFRVVLDYAHNPEGLRALGKLISGLKEPGARTIAMVSIPGDRRDEDMRAMGAVAAEYFDQLVFRETPDNRGRATGEVIRLLSEGALAAGITQDRILGVSREEEAVQASLDMARPGDLVVLTPTNVEPVWKQVLEHRPHPRPAPTNIQDAASGAEQQNG